MSRRAALKANQPAARSAQVSASTGPLDVVSPATGERIATLPVDDAVAIARKGSAARAAQPAWARRGLDERVDVLHRFHAAVLAQREALATTLAREVGKPIRQARSELEGLLPRIDFFAAHARQALADETVHREAGLHEVLQREALGVVANISAWNYPWYVGCNVLLPALLAGNAVLYKPSEFACLSGVEIVRLLHESGVPPDVLACVIGDGAAGQALLAQDIDGLFFTGSHATGARIAAALGGRFGVKLQLELGGKDPTYVCDDADARVAAASLAEGAMYNTGQSCCSVERIYVHARIHDVFVEHFVEAVRAMQIGDPLREDTTVGAITRGAQLEVLQRQVDEARALGATVHLGGRTRSGPGNWFEPTVVSHADHRMSLMREESFGPVVGIQRVHDDAEAVRLMNDTRYGLTAGVYTPSEPRARAILSAVRAGTVYWNCCDRVSPRLPWSGVGDSGVGLTLGIDGIRAFTRPKAWHLRS